MKKLILSAIFSLLIGVAAQAGTENKTESFKVSGNCDMCKKTIESSLKKKDGVISKQWDKNTKTISVTYNPEKITVQQIAQKIADSGYDNEYVKAKDEKYNKLHHCCQYERTTSQ